MPVTTIPLRPGVKREGTNLTNEGQWYDSDKVRFKAGYPEKIGGWIPYSYETYEGVARALYDYVSLNGNAKLALGTHSKLYISRDQLLYDITPVRVVVTLSDPFTFVNGSPIITVTDTAHGAAAGDYVVIADVSGTLNGVPDTELNAEHIVQTVVDANTYTIQVTTSATSSGTPVAANVEFTYLYPSGLPTSEGGPGWGTGLWSRGPWGSPVSTYTLSPLRLWSLSNYGQDLLACIRNGPIFFWAETDVYPPPDRAVDLTTVATDAPATATGVTVTESRHVVAFGAVPFIGGAQDRLLVRWSAQEDYTDWTPSSGGTAGEYRLIVGGEIVSWIQTRQEILIWTDKALYSMQYQGPPYTFSFTLLASNVSIAGPNAVSVVGNVVYWMGVDKFYMYNGQVQTLNCDVRSYVFDDFSQLQRLQIVSGSIERFNEIWWWYCDSDSIYPNKYVTFNFVENVWFIGSMQRTAWTDSGVHTNPIGAYDGILYYHEVGVDDVGIGTTAPIEAYIESADTDIDDGNDFMYIRRFIPDIDFTGSSGSPVVNVTISTRTNAGTNYRQTTVNNIVRTSTNPIDQYTEQVWVRMRGRQVAVRFESDAEGVRWQVGRVRLDTKVDGRK